VRTLGVLAAKALGAALALGCARTDGASRRVPASDLPVAHERAPESGPFACDAGVCVQRHVRLPDDGEWRCAEQDGTVWCAGGEPAAGVVNTATDRGYVCGARRGSSERVCVDGAPDYPEQRRDAFRCHFESDFGVQRVGKPQTVSPRALPSRRAPDCWLDRDCAPARCDRGYCVAVAR
jgi:hypothetical protein